MKKSHNLGVYLASLGLISLFLGVPFAQATLSDDFAISRSNHNNTVTFTDYIPTVTNGSYGIIGIDGSASSTNGATYSNGLPVTMTLGPGFIVTPTSPSSSELSIEVEMSAVTGLISVLNGKSADYHTHTIAQVEGLVDILENGIQYESHSHYIEDVLGLGAALSGKAPDFHTHLASHIEDLGALLDEKAETVHSHVIGDVTGLQTALNSKATTTDLGAVAFSNSYTDLANKPTLFSGSYVDLTNKPSLFSGSWNDLTDKPSYEYTTTTRSITTNTGAAGFQISATKRTDANYAVRIVTTATIANPASGYLVLETAPTNSATASDWRIVSRCGNGQNVGLALALSSEQTIECDLDGPIPAGWYAKIRSVTVSGSPAFTYLSGWEEKF